jgi:hypothetical protein
MIGPHEDAGQVAMPNLTLLAEYGLRGSRQGEWGGRAFFSSAKGFIGSNVIADLLEQQRKKT